MIVQTDTEFTQALSVLDQYSSWTVDVETNGLDAFGKNQLCGIGIAVDSPTSNMFYFPFRHHQGINLIPDQLDLLIEMMSSRAELLGYNVKFDLRFLDREGLRLDNKVLIDVMLLVRMTAHTTVRELGLTKTIARLFSVKDSQYDKETKKILQENKWSKDYSQAPPEVLGKYCELDAYWALQIYKKCLTVVEESGQTELLNLEHSLTKVLYDMESVGITIDSSYAQEVDRKIQNRLQEVEAKIFDLSGKEFNVRSNAEIADAFHQFGIYSLGKTPKGAESWDSKSLAQINHPLAGLIRQHRALTKLLSTYIEPYLDKKILHTTFCHWGTVTGRLSSRDPNLQNIPRNHFKLQDIQLTDTQRDVIRGRIDAMSSTDASSWLDDSVLDTWGFMGDESFDESDVSQIAIRRLFVPRTGYHLISIDYSQMEVRVFLSYLQNEKVTELLSKSSVDFHGEAAKIAFQVTEDHPEFKYYRQLAKGITFGIIYGIGNELLANQLGTSISEASQYKKRYLDAMEGSKAFIDTVMKAVEERGWVRNRYGRIYQIPKKQSYKGVNYLVQGTSADLLNERLVEVYKFLSDKRSSMLLQVHDEVILEIHDSEMHLLPAIVNIMQQNSLNIPLFVDQEICINSWAKKMDYSKYMTNLQNFDRINDKQVEEKDMAKISSHLGVTINVGKDGSNQYARLDVTISEIDTEIPLEPQLAESGEIIDKVFAEVKAKVMSQVKELKPD